MAKISLGQESGKRMSVGARALTEEINPCWRVVSFV